MSWEALGYGRGMELRPLVYAGGMIAAGLLLPFVVLFAVLDRPDVSRGLLLGLLVGLLNLLLLARKLDRAIDGRDPWQNLTRTMPRNMVQRFGLILVVGTIAARSGSVHLAGLAAGLITALVAGIVYAAWSITLRWKREDGTPVYENTRVVRP